jgi:hypothetical protein
MTESVMNKELHALLFEEGRELVNIKFIPGPARGLTANQLLSTAAEAVRGALAGELVNNPPLSGLQKSSIKLDFC